MVKWTDLHKARAIVNPINNILNNCANTLKKVQSRTKNLINLQMQRSNKPTILLRDNLNLQNLIHHYEKRAPMMKLNLISMKEIKLFRIIPRLDMKKMKVIIWCKYKQTIKIQKHRAISPQKKTTFSDRWA